MAAEKIHIDQFMELAKHHPVIDVRSPGEYTHAHMPGAYSLPLFTDEERKTVGTSYKQQSREQAIKIGLDFFGPKMRKMVEEVESLVMSRGPIAIGSGVRDTELPTANSILVYCWRGGMRSGAVSWLLDLYGFKVYTLIGGYKKYRNYTLDTFELPFQFKILGGYTGSGKTDTLLQLQKEGEPIIDLEGLANHKGSAFGNIGMPKQPTQEMFENLLAMKLRRSMVKGEWSKIVDTLFTIHHSPIWLEDESQRIGLVNIPNAIWNRMRKSPVHFMNIPFEERLKHLVKEYGGLDKQAMIGAISRITEKLGGLNAKTAIQLLEEGNTIESFRILLKYYDKYYFKALHNREGLNSLLNTIECSTVSSKNATLLLNLPQYQHEKS